MDLYHVMNRGVDRRIIFYDDQDRARFVHDMYEFNQAARAQNARRRFGATIDVGRRSLTRAPIVDIHGWCIMHNHYHLLLSERVDGGMSEFLKKLNGGYAKYFNEKNGRVGALFQGKTKRVPISRDAHFLHILHYIHLNPLDLQKESQDWRTLKIKNSRNAQNHLEQYRWSSYLDYCGVRNFPSILTTQLFKGVFNNYRKTINTYMHDMDRAKIDSLLLE